MNSSTNFSQNLGSKSSDACPSNYQGKRCVHKQNLETKNQILQNLEVILQSLTLQ